MTFKENQSSTSSSTSLTKTLNINLIYVSKTNPFCSAEQGKPLTSPAKSNQANSAIKLNKYGEGFFDKYLSDICENLKVLVIKKSFYDFSGQGTSGLFLIADDRDKDGDKERDKNSNERNSNEGRPAQENNHLYHLDKSHLGVHTYLDEYEENFFFRIDFEISSCGLVSPLKIIPKVIGMSNAINLRGALPEVILLDYRERGLVFAKSISDFVGSGRDGSSGGVCGEVVKNQISAELLKQYRISEEEHSLKKIYYLELRKKNFEPKLENLFNEII